MSSAASIPGQAQSIRLRDWRSPPMRAFHLGWIAFFLCFFAWFAIAPLMHTVVGPELGLTKQQIALTTSISVVASVLARILIGWLCDRFGPRRTYAGLLFLGSLPVASLCLVRSFEGLLMARLAIGAIGASFVVTQYHTSRMFAPRCVGTANATTAGWGNLGGGAAQIMIPLAYVGLMGLGISSFWSWRLTMVGISVLLVLTGLAYLLYTQDEPGDRQSAAQTRQARKGGLASLKMAGRDYRVWCLALLYGACFGMELTVYNHMAAYFQADFGLSVAAAGAATLAYGGMNIFSRTLGGWGCDRFGMRWGLSGRATWLFMVLLSEGVLLMLFSQVHTLAVAIPVLMLFALFVQMSSGATFGVVPFIQPGATGSVMGIVGAGSNACAVGFALLFGMGMEWNRVMLYLGAGVAVTAFLALAIRPLAQTSEDEASVPEAGLSVSGQ